MSEGMIGLVPLGEIRGVVVDLLEKLTGREGPAFAHELKQFVIKQPCWVFSPVPEDDVEFELTMTQAPDPLDMIREDRYDNWKKWKFRGPFVVAPNTKTFVLLNLGYCSNLDDAKKKVDKKGFVLAEGQWRAAFRQKFPKPTRSIAVIFAGSEWVDPDDERNVLDLVEEGDAWSSYFGCSAGDFDEGCRWLAYRKPLLHPIC